MKFINTNYFLQFLIKDNSSQQQQSVEIFKSVQRGEVELYTSLVIFFEIQYVLTKIYNLKQPETLDRLSLILTLPNLVIEHGAELRSSLELWQQNALTFPACFHTALSEKINCAKFLTFDKKLRNSINRRVR